jgi:hypothetical protein
MVGEAYEGGVSGRRWIRCSSEDADEMHGSFAALRMTALFG